MENVSKVYKSEIATQKNSLKIALLAFTFCLAANFSMSPDNAAKEQAMPVYENEKAGQVENTAIANVITPF